MLRDIVKIDEEKCNGCGLCVPACAEGAIQIINGKARLLAENLCDGLGACLGDCPQDAITIEKRQADAFDEELVHEHLKKIGREPLASHSAHPAPPQGGCPSAQVASFGGGCPSSRVQTHSPTSPAEETATSSRPSRLRQWPVQMTLVPPTAPFLQNADLLLAADCAPFAYADFHQDILKDRPLLIGCPKLDDGQAYVEKLTAILQHNDLQRLTVVHMEVPCCSGLIAIARQAIAASGKEVRFETLRIGIRGDLQA